MTVLNNDSLGHRIKVQRLNMGMTQEQLAEVMCVPKSTISAYENNKVDIKSSVILELSRALNTTPNYILGCAEEQDPALMRLMILIRKIKNESVLNILYAQISAVSDIASL